MFRSGVGDTFISISPRLLGVRKSSWVFWKALVALHIDIASTIHWRAIDAKFRWYSRITFWKIIKNLEIFSKNRSKNFLKHFFENLSCAFFIRMILYLKRAFPGTLQVRKCGTNLFGNPNRLQKCGFSSSSPSPHRWLNGALMTRQWTVDTMSM